MVRVTMNSIDPYPEKEQEEIVPTDEELKILPRVGERIPYLSWLMIIFVMCQSFAAYGQGVLLQNYIQFPVPGPNETQPGALNLGQQVATAWTTAFQLYAFVTPILGAILADQYWGKFRTILISCVLHIIAELVLILTSIPPSIEKGFALPGLIIMMVIFGLASGGIHANLASFMAEQSTRQTCTIRGRRNPSNPSVAIDSVLLELHGIRKILDPQMFV